MRGEIQRSGEGEARIEAMSSSGEVGARDERAVSSVVTFNSQLDERIEQ